MKHLFLNKDLSLLAKGKGFDEPCFMVHFNHGESWSLRYWGNIRAIYRNEDKISPVKNSWVSKFKDECIAAPLYQQIIDWFFDKHNINIYTKFYGDCWTFKIQIDENKVLESIKDFKISFCFKDMALDYAINEVFKLI